LQAGIASGGALLLRRGIAVAEALVPPAPCALTPELEEGPYYVASELMRSDIREGKPGLPLHLRISVVDKTTCKPLPNAAVDIWHCDAMGIYSGYEKQSLGPMGPPGEGGPGGRPPRGPGNRQGGPPLDENGNPLPPPGGFGGPGGPGGFGGPPHSQISDNDRFFRGVQISGNKGEVDFLTVYPGWYQGRDTHIHVKVHVGGKDALGHDKTLKDATTGPELHVYTGGQVCFTGQMAFDDAFSDRVAKLEPYRTHNLRRTRLDEDHVFEGRASDVFLKMTQMDAGKLEAGVSGSIVFAVDPAEIWKEQHGPDGGPPRGRRNG
jgi:protocatechuate 3,4-dioxygenase beta subunit